MHGSFMTRTVCLIIFMLLFMQCTIDGNEGNDGWLRIEVVDGAKRVTVAHPSGAALTSPPEGLWSIAAGWREKWPAEWHHAHPGKVYRAGEWTIVEGTLPLDAGEWRLRDAYRREGALVRCTRRFTWTGKSTLKTVTLSVRFQAPAATKRVLLPGILYYGNPSGAASGRVPVYAGKPGEEALFEEHRYPMPLAALAWTNSKAGRDDASSSPHLGAALHTLPSPVPHGTVRDQWWSLGVVGGEAHTTLTLLSGPCAGNGKRSVIKAVQPGFVPYPQACLEVPPGAVVEKTFYLQTYPVAREGAGFITPLKASIAENAPYTGMGLPTFADIIAAKWRFARTRWFSDGQVAGFKKYPDRDFLVFGWCGQAASPGYALQVLAPQLAEGRPMEKVRKSLDFLSRAAFYDGGFHTWYDIAQKQWKRHEPLSQGQGMLNFALAIDYARRHGGAAPAWERFLRKACEFHARRILNDAWRPRSTDEGFFIAPLCMGARLFEEDLFRRAAIKAGNVYCRRHLSMREPYWGGTLDARCEDKEGAYAAFQGFLFLHDLTGDAAFLEAAEHALYVVLSYVCVWDIDMPPGRLRDHGFKTRGWTVVSPQNQHIDAYGVIIAPDIYRFACLKKDAALKDLALVMFRSCGQLMDPFGSHGEQPQHTNYAQRGRVDDIFALRGGYQEHWTVFWLTAHFLNAAARFKELGVDVGAAAAGPVKVIFDTDIQGDADDVGTVAVLHALADRGEAAILAMGISSKNPWSPLCLSSLNTYFNRGDVPIGVLKGPGSQKRSRYAQAVAEEFPRTLRKIDDAPDAALLYRRILAGQPDHSVVMVTVGFISNLRNLLKTGPDAISPLTGRELVARKVKVWVCMGGQFPEGKEACNFKRDSQAAAHVIQHWPTKAIFSGGELGERVQTGSGLKVLPKDSPVRRGYELYNGLTNRASWDQTALLYAVRGLQGGLDHVWDRRTGTLLYDLDTAYCRWQDDPDGRHTYMVEKMPPGKVAAMIEQLMLHTPKKMR